jgi:hypothetical protein
MARAYRCAVASGPQLRLVVTAPVVRRVLSLTGLDRVVPAYPLLEAAVAAGTPVPDTAAVTPAVVRRLVDAGRSSPCSWAGRRSPQPGQPTRGRGWPGSGSGSGAELPAWAGIDPEHIAAAARELAGG